MRILTTVLVLIVGEALGLAFPGIVLWTEPDQPAYLTYVPSLLTSAQEEILVALSDLRAYGSDATGPLLSALTEAAKRGVRVYVLVERSSRDPYLEQRKAWEALRAAGAEVREDDPTITLHAKFLVIDRTWVVVGSTHWTKTSLTQSVQVDLALGSPELASSFRTFFFLLWEGRLQAKPRLPGWERSGPLIIPILDLPESQGHFEMALSLINQARSEVDLLMYQAVYYAQYEESASTQLLGALGAAARRGVRVRVILEGREDDPYLEETNRFTAAWLAIQGVEVRLDPLGQTMHAKCLIVDGKHALVSSANWTYSSMVKNLEAGVLLWEQDTISQALLAGFEGLWQRSRPIT